MSLTLNKALSPVRVKSLFLLPPIRGEHAERGGGERTGHLHRPAYHSGELIRGARSPVAWCCAGTTSDTTSALSASTPRRETSRRKKARHRLLTACHNIKVSRCNTLLKTALTACLLSHSGLLEPQTELWLLLFVVQWIKQLKLITAAQI